MLLPIKYRAFISYAHADSSWTRWLHRQLERYEIPINLVGQVTAAGTIPKSLRPIFRDRDDFSGGNEKIDATIAALDASAALIVVCSPTAPKRPAVIEEVRLFRSRHPDRPVIPVVIGGTIPECFPLPLRYEVQADGTLSDRASHILAVDLRASADGKRLGLAKIVAGLTGVSADQIALRAEQRARRQLQRRITGITALGLTLSLLAGWAWYERVERQTLAMIEQIRTASDLQRIGSYKRASEIALPILSNSNYFIPESYSIIYNNLYNQFAEPKRIEIGSSSVNGNNFVIGKRNQIIHVLTDTGNFSAWSHEGVNIKRNSLHDMEPIRSINNSNQYYYRRLSNGYSIGQFQGHSRTMDWYKNSPDLIIRRLSSLFTVGPNTLFTCFNNTVSEFSIDSSKNVLNIVSSHTLFDIKSSCEAISRLSSGEFVLGVSTIKPDRLTIQLFDSLNSQKPLNIVALDRKIFGSIESIVTKGRSMIVKSTFSFAVITNLENRPIYLNDSSFPPTFSPDGRYIVYGGGSEPRKHGIIDLSNEKFVTRFFDGSNSRFVGFYNDNTFITLDNEIELNRRSIETGEIIQYIRVYSEPIQEVKTVGGSEIFIAFPKGPSTTALFVNHSPLNNKIMHKIPGRNIDLRRLEKVFHIEFEGDDIVIYTFLSEHGYFMFPIKWIYKKVFMKNGRMRSFKFITDFKEMSNIYQNIYQPLKRDTINDDPSEEIKLLPKTVSGNDRISLFGNKNVITRLELNYIVVLDKDNGKELFKIGVEAVSMSSLWVSDDKKKFAAGFEDGTLKLWNLDYTPSPIAIIQAHPSDVTRLAANNVGDYLVSSDIEGNVRWWPLHSKEQLIRATERTR